MTHRTHRAALAALTMALAAATGLALGAALYQDTARPDPNSTWRVPGPVAVLDAAGPARHRRHPMNEPKTIPEMTAEVRAVNVEHGWRTGGNTFGDYIALLHSELSEALEAYRDWRLADATGGPDGPRENSKPEGVGSEFADVLIRLLDVADIYGIDLDAEYARKIAYNRTRPYQHGGRTLSDVGRVTR